MKLKEIRKFGLGLAASVINQQQDHPFILSNCEQMQWKKEILLPFDSWGSQGFLTYLKAQNLGGYGLGTIEIGIRLLDWDKTSSFKQTSIRLAVLG